MICQLSPLSWRLRQLPHQKRTIRVRNAGDFCPIFTRVIFVIIEPEITPFQISHIFPTRECEVSKTGERGNILHCIRRTIDGYCVIQKMIIVYGEIMTTIRSRIQFDIVTCCFILITNNGLPETLPTHWHLMKRRQWNGFSKCAIKIIYNQCKVALYYEL